MQSFFLWYDEASDISQDHALRFAKNSGILTYRLYKKKPGQNAPAHNSITSKIYLKNALIVSITKACSDSFRYGKTGIETTRLVAFSETGKSPSL